MHFVFEALHKRPLESKSLAISRGVSAILLSCCFLAYVGYLIYQVYNDRTLLLLSTYNIPDTGYLSPDVEMCVSGSTFTITSCVLQDMDYNPHVIPGCEGFLNYGATDDPSEKCIAFQGNNSKVMFAANTDTSKGPNLVHRVDIFWAIDNLTAVSSQSLSRPNMAITTMSQEFSSWRITPDDMKELLPEQAITWNSLQLQKYVSSSTVNQSTMIYFEPSRYRALKKNAQSVLGLNSTYYEMDIIETNQFEWEFNHQFPNYETYGNYQGQFGIALRTSNIQTEQRQHTVLSALAMTGGAYGVIVALYILFFGTPRLTPFGVSHNLSMWFYRGRTKLGSNKMKNKDEEDDDDHHLRYPITNQPPSSSKRTNDVNNSDLAPTYSHIEHSSPCEKAQDEEYTSTTSRYTSTSDQEQHHLVSISPHAPPVPPHHPSPSLLESRVEELEVILREYFLNVEYLDALRRRRQEMLPVYQQQADPVLASSGLSNRQSTNVAPPRKSITGNDWRQTS